MTKDTTKEAAVAAEVLLFDGIVTFAEYSRGDFRTFKVRTPGSCQLSDAVSRADADRFLAQRRAPEPVDALDSPPIRANGDAVTGVTANLH